MPEAPLNARSVILSTLLGTEPPRLPVAQLVRAAALFGISEGTTRTSLSRMSSRGEVVRDGDGRYALAGSLLDRQARQRASRRAEQLEWNGRWRQAVVTADERSAADRAALRTAMRTLRLAEQREGVWLRPDNLEGLSSDSEARHVVDAQCRWSSAYPDLDDAQLAAALWDLDGWAARATELRRELAGLLPALARDDTAALAPGFVVSAAVLRHFQADPLLPIELSPRSWPGPRLRSDYERFDTAYRSVLRRWLLV